MDEIIHCPSCRRPVRLPLTLVGFDVQCPGCGATFTGQLPRGLAGENPHDRDSGADRALPNRAATIVTMGLLSLPGAFLCGVPGIVLGTMAWVTGSRDLQEMRHGDRDAEGENLTAVGRTCGLIGLILGFVEILVVCAYAVLNGTLSVRD
jgi:hypothetical protein